MSKINWKNKTFLTKAILIIYFSVGVAGLIWPVTADLFTRLIPLTLLASIVVLLAFHEKWEMPHIRVFTLIALLGYLIEVAGVLTGLVFGEYQYHYALGFKIFGTPPIIGINWLMLIYAVYGIFEFQRLPAWLKILGGASLMVAYDIILEPVAITLNMWSWGGGDIPIQNYIAWFVISVVFLVVMHLAKVRTNNPISKHLFMVQLAFFMVLNIYFRLV
jgi:putative membrane protein